MNSPHFHGRVAGFEAMSRVCPSDSRNLRFREFKWQPWAPIGSFDKRIHPYFILYSPATRISFSRPTHWIRTFRWPPSRTLSPCKCSGERSSRLQLVFQVFQHISLVVVPGCEGFKVDRGGGMYQSAVLENILSKSPGAIFR